MGRTAEPEVVSEALSIVLRGHFNPAIISPAWLVNKGLLGEGEAGEIEEQTIVPRASIFVVSWLRVEATDDRFAVHCQDPLEYRRLRDVAVGVLDALPETPVVLLGINRNWHIQLPSEGTWHSVGDMLMPKEPWADTLKLPGLRTATVEGVRSDGILGFVRVRVEPSSAVPNGLFVEVNDHYILEREREAVESREQLHSPENLEAMEAVRPSADRLPLAREILTDGWDRSLGEATRVLDRVIRMVQEA